MKSRTGIFAEVVELGKIGKYLLRVSVLILVVLTGQAEAGEVVARGKLIQLFQVAEYDDEIGYYSKDGALHHLIVGSTIDENGDESRSLIDFSAEEIVAYNFENVIGQSVVTHKFFGVFPSKAALSGFRFEFRKDSCETKETRVEYVINGKNLEAILESKSGTYCRTGLALYPELTGQADRETVNHKVFTPDFSVQGFGRGYRDQDGLIWSRAQIAQDGSVVYQSYSAAQIYCGNLGARLPSVGEVRKFQDAIKDYDHPYYPISGGTIIPSFPYTKKSWSYNSYNAPANFVYDSKVTQIIPGLESFGKYTHFIFTGDQNTVWNASIYNQLIQPMNFYRIATICVK